MALIKEVKRETVRREWHAISMLFAQLVLALLIVFQVVQLIGLHVDPFLRQVVIKPSLDPANLIVLAIAVLLFALLYFAVKKRQPALYQAQKRAPGIIKQEAKRKLRNAKDDPRVAALLLIDFMFVIVVVLAIRAYLDPELELIPWSAAGLGPPLTTVVNTIIAVVVLALFYYMYRFTVSYRNG